MWPPPPDRNSHRANRPEPAARDAGDRRRLDYIGNLVSALGSADDRNGYVAYVTDQSATLVPSRANFRRVRIPIQPRIRSQRILAENTILQALVRRDGLDCLHWFANGQGVVNAAPAVVTIFDLQPFLEEAQLSTLKRTLLQSRLRAAVRSAAMLLPMSQTTADDLSERLGADRARMSVIPPILESLFVPADRDAIERCRAAHNLPPEFWLYVAHLYPHKNHERLLQAYRAAISANREVWPLVLRGDPQPGGPNLAERIGQLGLAGHVIILPGLPREELPALYGAASALLFPSLYEGAGIPVLEAQACGCPVVGSKIAAVKEFGGEGVCYFDPLDTEDITRAMMRIAADAAARRELRARGLLQAQMFREIPVTDRLIAAYTHAARKGPNPNPR